MINNNNEFYQNSMINARKDNDEWKNAAGTCSPELIEKSITENGTYTASSDSADGYSSVKVDVPSAPTPETFAVTLNIEYINSSSFNFSSSKTLQEALAAHGEGKTLIFTINWTNNGQTITSTNSSYFVLNNFGIDYFLISFTLTDSGQAVFYPLTWASDANAGDIENRPFLSVIPN